MKIPRKMDISDGSMVWNAGAIIIINSNPGIQGRVILGKIIKVTVTENIQRIVIISGGEMTKIVETITKEKINWIGKMISD